MFGIQHYVSFVTAILIFQLVPGPGTLAFCRVQLNLSHLIASGLNNL